MSMVSELQKPYALLIGVGSPWEVKNVALTIQEKQVVIELGWQWVPAPQCSEGDRECCIHDFATERTWRHLDTMPFTTLIRARHLDNLRIHLKHHITNAVTKGWNSKVQTLKAGARGLRNFRNYRIRILFFCGKLHQVGRCFRSLLIRADVLEFGQ